MAERARKKPTAPFDIFGDERLDAAMSAATAAAPKEAKEPEEEGEAGVVLEDVVVVEAEETPKTEVAEQREGQGDTAPSRSVADPEPVRTIEENVPLKFQVPRGVRSEFQAFKAELSAALGGVVLDDSNVGRALLDRLLRAEREGILDAARGRAGELRRPKNGDPEAMAAFDEAIRALLNP